MKPKRRPKSFHIVVHRDQCKACYLCMDACPKGVFEKEEGFNLKGYQPIRVARPEECIGCRACILVCPDVVFELYELEESA